MRSHQVIRALIKACPEIRVHLRTTVPKWLLEEPGLPVSLATHSIDVGVLQKDSLEMDLEKTLAACQALHEQIPALVQKEVAFIEREGIRLALGDIPPLCFEIAAAASLPSVAIGNFTWDWIYRAYSAHLPSFLPLVQEMEKFYSKATLALSLPFSCDLRVFPHQVSIPLIARLSSLDKREARRKYGLPEGAAVVLISFGGFGLDRLAWEKLKHEGEFLFVTTGRVPKREKNLAVLAEAQPRYEELVAAADAVVTKPGYGIVADVIAHRVPVLYTSRGEFAEYPFLVEALRRWATSAFIPQDELLQGDLGPYLGRLLKTEANWPAVPLNGGQIAAEKILELL